MSLIRSVFFKEFFKVFSGRLSTGQLVFESRTGVFPFKVEEELVDRSQSKAEGIFFFISGIELMTSCFPDRHLCQKAFFRSRQVYQQQEPEVMYLEGNHRQHWQLGNLELALQAGEVN